MLRILIDAYGIAYRIWYGNQRTLKSTEYPEGFFLYLYVKQILKIVRSIYSYHGYKDGLFISPFLIWDTPTSRLIRQAIYPEYKLGERDKKNKETRTYLNGLIGKTREILSRVNPRYGLCHPDLEADDFIAEVVSDLYREPKQIEQYKNGSDYPTVVVTNDSDLSQLLSFSHSMVIYNHLKNLFITSTNYPGDYKSPPEWTRLHKVLVSDSTDNWRGVKGFGIKSFIKLMDKYSNPEDALESVRTKSNEKTIELGIKLVGLPSSLVSDEQSHDCCSKVFELERRGLEHSNWELVFEEFDFTDKQLMDELLDDHWI